MTRNRLLLCVGLVWASISGFGLSAALAKDACQPVETAPGIKMVPAGCNALAAPQQARPVAAKPRAPAAKPSALFPGTAPGSISQFGGTEFRVNGQVRIDYGYGR